LIKAKKAWKRGVIWEKGLLSDDVTFSVFQFGQLAFVPAGYLAEILGDFGNAFHIR
jgi:hypothetical protein